MFSGETSEEQTRDYGRGRGTVDCCYPVKCMFGHYGELMFGQKHKIDILLSPMIYTLPSFLHGHVVNSLSCPRVMAAPENIKAGFTKEKDVFAGNGIRIAPLVSLAEPAIVPKQLFPALAQVLPGLQLTRPGAPSSSGYRRARDFNQMCARNDARSSMVRAQRPALHPGPGAALSY